MSAIDRRQFLERMLALGGGALATAALLSMLGCSEEPTSDPSADDAAPADNKTPSDGGTPPDDATPPDNSSTPDNTSPPDDTTPSDDATPSDDTTPPDDSTPPGDAYLAVARGGNPTALVESAINALGGIGRFVKPGNDVIIKPNICVDYRTPEYAATTNPEVVGALVALCIGAGARRVRVMDRPFGGTAENAYTNSGIAAAVKAAGGEMEVMASMKFQPTTVPDGKAITSCRVYQDILETDVLIDVPIPKEHGNAVLSLGMKNLLGVVDDPYTTYHKADMDERVTDLTSLVRPDLTVIDAIRILTTGGPTGGSLDYVERTNTVIASHDIVAADSYAATLFGKTASDVPITLAGARRGLGTMDLSKVNIQEIAV